MTLEQLRDELDKWEDVRYRIDTEGMEYCFKKYSSFEEIKDEEFHFLREGLIDMMTKMEEFIQQKITESEDKIIEHPENDWNN